MNITVNGQPVEAAPGEWVIAAAERAGVYIPHFCYHPRMNSVGMCRMCIVDIDTGRGPALQPSCMVAVSEGMVVDTTSEQTRKAQDGVLEFLLLNHPLDCPVCDKGGECPLPGSDHGVWPRREPVHRREAPLRKAHPGERSGVPRPGALHPVRPLHPIRRRGGRRPAHHLPRPGRPNPGEHLPRPALLLLLQRQHRADLPSGGAHRGALSVQGPPLGPHRGWSPPIPTRWATG